MAAVTPKSPAVCPRCDETCQPGQEEGCRDPLCPMVDKRQEDEHAQWLDRVRKE